MNRGKDDELRKVLAECIQQEKAESGEVTVALRSAINCPYCDERISGEARKCPHCQSILDKRLLPKHSFWDFLVDCNSFLVRLVLWCVLVFAGGVVLMCLFRS